MSDPRHQPVPPPPGSTPTPTPTPSHAPLPPGVSPAPSGAGWQATAWPAYPAHSAHQSHPAHPPHPAAGKRRTPGWVIALAITTAVLSVAAFTTVLLWPTGEGARTSGPLEFHAFTQVARIPYDQSSSTAFTQIVDDQVYVAWEQDGDLMVVAARLEDGAELWRQRVSGSPQWGDLFGLAGAAVAVGADSGGAERMYALDAGGGAVLWEREVGSDDWAAQAEDYLVWYNADSERLQGVEVASGRDSWTLPVSAEAVSTWTVVDEDLARPTDTEGSLGFISTDYRVVVVDEDDTAYVVDGRNGIVISQGENVARTRDVLLAYEGRLYVAADDSGFQVLSYSLDDLGGLPRTHYRAAPDRYPESLEPCGSGRLCLLETESFDRDTTELVAVDVAEDLGELWRQPVPDGRSLLPVGPWVTVAGFDIPVRGFSAEGVEVFNRAGVVARLNAGNFLVFADDLYEFAQDLSVAGASVTGEPPTELGHLPDVVGKECSWSTIYLTCPDRDGATIWRFAEEP